MTVAARLYAPSWVLAIWALLIVAGLDPVVSMVPGLLLEAVAVKLYVDGRRR